MAWELMDNSNDNSRPMPLLPEEKPFRAQYLKVLALYFAGLTLSFPVQIFFLLDLNLNDPINWSDFLQQIPWLNWTCMASYSTTAVALSRKSTRIWAHLSSAILLTGINNAFVAFAGWDYSSWQILSGSFLFALPVVPTLVLPKYRRMIWQYRDLGRASTASPRYKKRWRVEILSEGQAVPAAGITVNISDSGALIHLLNQASTENQFDIKLSEAQQGLILSCKARRVREDVLAGGSQKPIPVVGVQFLELSEEQKELLQASLTNNKAS